MRRGESGVWSELWSGFSHAISWQTLARLLPSVVTGLMVREVTRIGLDTPIWVEISREYLFVGMIGSFVKYFLCGVANIFSVKQQHSVSGFSEFLPNPSGVKWSCCHPRKLGNVFSGGIDLKCEWNLCTLLEMHLTFHEIGEQFASLMYAVLPQWAQICSLRCVHFNWSLKLSSLCGPPFIISLFCHRRTQPLSNCSRGTARKILSGSCFCMWRYFQSSFRMVCLLHLRNFMTVQILILLTQKAQ